MALTPPVITSSIIAAGPELNGANWFRLATAIGSAVFGWAVVPANLVVQGVTSGVAGGGSVDGKLIVPPVPLPVPTAALQGALLGFLTPSVTRAIGMGVAAAFTASARYTGKSLGVGSGGDISKVTFANPVTLAQQILAVGAGSGLQGVHMPVLAATIGTGVANLLLTGTGIGVVYGSGSPIPAGGTSFSRVV